MTETYEQWLEKEESHDGDDERRLRHELRDEPDPRALTQITAPTIPPPEPPKPKRPRRKKTDAPPPTPPPADDKQPEEIPLNSEMRELLGRFGLPAILDAAWAVSAAMHPTFRSTCEAPR